MPQDDFRIEAALAADSDRLATIRVEAMRPSLEAVGRFDPVRARDRFLDTYCHADTKIILTRDGVAGFFVARKHAGHLYLDHLYVSIPFQGRGIGRRVINLLKTEARSCALPIRLIALNGSPANEFYQSCGFASISRDALDTLYEWMPER
ncbi:GNAT family N-acetyltransferase [Frigidibacter mobilis]|uniref:GNAT family N-acetyltransferase n=1 Tax=Frigidibacter mobilis TaxID=1335048 RepID=UPI001F1E4266|nr:GNAT family N-acetyltransferase [Frigidibacter mobilis]